MRKKPSTISRTIIAITSTFLMAVWLMGMPRLAATSRAAVQAPTCLTVMSGNGPIGTTDPLVQVTPGPPGAPAFVQAEIVAPFILGIFSWSTISGTQWVGLNQDRSGTPFSNFTFRTTFTLPASFSSPTITVQVHSDNVTTVFLNNNQIGAQPDIVPNGDIANFQDPPESFTNSNAAFFHAGSNDLTFVVKNYADAIGLDFKADICFSPAQGCVDDHAPSISCSVAQNELWPPNHQLEDVGLRANISDDCDCFSSSEGEEDKHHTQSIGNTITSSDGKKKENKDKKKDEDGDDDDDEEGDCPPPTGSHAVSVAVFSDEPDLDILGSGNFSPDAKNIGIGTLRLRAERSGNADGRVYLIVITATDASGKSSTCVKTVTVTHDQSKASKDSVVAQANAAKAFFAANHMPPPTFVQVGVGPIVGPKQ